MRTRILIALLFGLLYGQPTSFGQPKEPIIDMHIHAHGLWTGGDTSWYPKQFQRPSNSNQLMLQTVEELKKNNIVLAVASGYTTKTIKKWEDALPNIFMGGYETDDVPSKDDIEKLRQSIKAGDTKVLAEICTQYAGVNPSDSLMEPLYKLAEEFDVPVGIHMGIGPPGAAYVMPYRSRFSSPLLLEEALVRHPKVRFYIMHAGWPMLDDMVAILYAFPNVYVDIAVINWYIPKAEFYTYLKRLVDAGFSKRIMYGSDQMQWPESISASIKEIEDASFLSYDQKRDILYNNAVKFLKIHEKK
jgi:uncharacterized protein